MATKRSNYFTNVPLVDYNGLMVRNILLSAKLTARLLSGISVYLPFIVSEGETPGDVAFNYYGDTSYQWLVFLSNRIIDPYYQWPLNQQDLDATIAKKYGSLSAAQSLIVHYAYEGVDYKMNPLTYSRASTEARGGWYPVYAYEHEFAENERKRSIQLIDDSYRPQLERELQRIFKRGVR